MTDFTATDTRVSTAGFDLGAAGITPPSSPNRRGVFLADVIVELGLADQDTIDRAQQAAQETERSLERYLLDSAILDEDSLSRAIAERNGLDHVDLHEFEVDMEAAQMVTRSAAERYGAVPVAFASDGALIVAVQDPFDTLGTSDIEVMTRSSVRPAIATATGIDALIQRLPEQPVSPALGEEPEADTVEPEESAEAGGNGEPMLEVNPPAEAWAQPESIVELGSPADFGLEPDAAGEVEPEIEIEAGVEIEPTIEIEPEIEIEPTIQIEPTIEIDAAVEVEADREPGPGEPEVEADREPESGESEFELVQFPEAEIEPEEEPEPEAVFDLKPELVRLPQPSGDAATYLESELGSLQETARRADELAATVERRITELKTGADERVARLDADLAAAQRRVEELEAQVSGVDTLAEELRATTAKLEEVNRVLEGSVR
ncbi:MAG TPA: hypothetical protein VH476_10600 [Solirubrobacterales bacterium]